ncbi:hypothetical protein ACHAXR_008972 [Thalassiosira sp. AJA248-18]
MRSLLSMAVVAAAIPTNNLALALSTSSRIRTTPQQPLRSKSSPSSSVLFPSSSSSSSSPLVVGPRILLESTIEETLEETTETANLSPFLQGMVDEQRELQMNVGKAMDVLRKDYPYFMKRAPDFSIYHDSISLTSATDGQLQLSKLSSYKKAFGVMRTMLSLLYDTDKSVIQSRMVYDATRTQIRVSFNANLVPKMGKKMVHVDGISVYSIDLSPTMKEDENGTLQPNGGAGKIIEHRIEKMLVNGAALQPPYFNAFGMEMMSGNSAGALVGAGAWGCLGVE